MDFSWLPGVLVGGTIGIVAALLPWYLTERKERKRHAQEAADKLRALIHAQRSWGTTSGLTQPSRVVDFIATWTDPTRAPPSWQAFYDFVGSIVPLFVWLPEPLTTSLRSAIGPLVVLLNTPEPWGEPVNQEHVDTWNRAQRLVCETIVPAAQALLDFERSA